MRRCRQREICSQRETQQSDALRIDLRLARYEADRIPQSFHPGGKVAEDGLQAIDFSGAGAVEIMQHIHREALLGEQARGCSH